MIYQWLHSHYGWAGLLIATGAFGLILYALVASLSYFVVFVRGHDRFVPGHRHDPQKIRRAILWSVYGTLGNAVLVLPVQLLIVHGYFPLYDDIATHGWLYLVVSLIGAIVFAETCIYWIHRALHTRVLYRTLHVHHHRFREPTPYASLAFHPVDSFSQSLPYHIYALFVPMYVWAYLTLFVFALLWSLMIHDQVRWVPFRFVNHTGCHTAHHWFFSYNFGNYFTFWDRLCGTYLDPEALPEKFVASKQALFGGGSGLAHRPSALTLPVVQAPRRCYFRAEGHGAPQGAQAPAKSSGETGRPLEGEVRWSASSAAKPNRNATA